MLFPGPRQASSIQDEGEDEARPTSYFGYSDWLKIRIRSQTETSIKVEFGLILFIALLTIFTEGHLYNNEKILQFQNIA